MTNIANDWKWQFIVSFPISVINGDFPSLCLFTRGYLISKTTGKLTVCYGNHGPFIDGLPNLKMVMFYSKLLVTTITKDSSLP
jgi:hypothetical protein